MLETRELNLNSHPEKLKNHFNGTIDIDMIKDEDHKMMTQYLSKDYLRAIIYKKMNQEDQSKSFFEEKNAGNNAKGCGLMR